MKERFFCEDIEEGNAPLFYDLNYHEGIFTLLVRSEVLAVIVGRKRFIESLPDFATKYPIGMLNGGWSELKFSVTPETVEIHAQVLAIILSALEYPPKYSQLFEQYHAEGLLQESLITGITHRSVQATFSPRVRAILIAKYPNREGERLKLVKCAQDFWNRYIDGRPIEDEARVDSIRVTFTKEGTAYLRVPGNSCGLGVDGFANDDANSGFTLVSHNHDTPAQMLTLLVYIALLGR